MKYKENKMRTKPTSPVRIERVKEVTGTASSKNMYHKDNVNVAQGPRLGNAGARAGKRATFQDAKADRAPLADVITSAYAARQEFYKDHAQPKSGSIMPDVKPKRLK
jgi:hypothetical protein